MDNPFAPPESIEFGHRPAAPDDGVPRALASRGDRFAAQLLDGLLLIPGIAVGGALIGIAGDPESAMSVVGVLLMAVLVTGTFIYQWYLISTTGQSLGKRWMQIKIRRQDGTEAGFVHGVLIRVWVMQMLGGIPLIGSIISLVDVLMIFGEPRRCLHDHLATTEVISVKA